MKYLIILIIFFEVSFAQAEISISGHWALFGARSCLNGSKIEDKNFTENISKYSYQISTESNLILSMKFLGAPVSISYNLKSLGADNNVLLEATPINKNNSASPFQIIFDGKAIYALFEDSKSNFCGGGFILARMLRP